MYFQITQEYRALYINSLNKKASEAKAKGGCLASMVFILAMMLFILTGIVLMFSVDITTEILNSGFDESFAALAVQVMIGAFAVSVVLLILGIVLLAKFNKKAKEADKSVADDLRQRYGNAVYEEVKRQIISEDTFVIVRDQWQKERFCFLTADWLAYEREFVRLDGIACAYPFLDTNRTGGGGVGLRCLYLLLENGAYVEFPLDWPDGVIHEIIQLLKQKMPAIYTDALQKSQTVTIQLEDGKSLSLPSDKDKLIDLYKRKRENLRRQSALQQKN